VDIAKIAFSSENHRETSFSSAEKWTIEGIKSSLEQGAETMISKRKRILVVGMLAGILAVFLVVAGVFIAQFNRYRASGGSESIDPTLPQVSINIPTGDNTFIVGQPSPVYALAIGYDPFLSMELWVDGILAGVDAGPSSGMTPFNGEFLWIPTQPGLHILIARAKDSAQHVANSASLMVIVLPDETISASTSEGENLTGGESSVPIVYPAAGSTSQPPAPPGPDTTSGPSQPWEGSPGDWVTSLTAGEPPSAPELVAAPVACGATLAIHDLSDNEEGFIVYRQKLYARMDASRHARFAISKRVDPVWGYRDDRRGLVLHLSLQQPGRSGQ